MSRHSIKGALHNFLGTYTSRYSDYEGYWLFGMLVSTLEQLDLELLQSPDGCGRGTPIDAARQRAKVAFRDQICKAGLSLSCVREAALTISKSSGIVTGNVNGHICPGNEVTFLVRAMSDHGREYMSQRTLFVAVHDPWVEFKSVR